MKENRSIGSMQQDAAKYMAEMTERLPLAFFKYCVMPKRGFEYVSPAIEKLTGYSAEEHYADADLGYKIVHPEDLHILQNSEPHSEPYVVRFIDKIGNILWVEHTLSYDYDEQGELISIFGFVRDVSIQRQAVQDLKQSKDIMEVTQSISGVGGWEWQIEDQKMYWTPQMYMLHDMDESSITPGSPEHIQRSLACYNPEHRQIVMDAFEKCVHEGTPYDLELPFTTEKGRKIWVRIASKAFYKDEKIYKVIGNFQDISKYKEAIKTLALNEERLRLVYKASNDVIWEYDAATHTQFWNEAGQRVFGWDDLNVPTDMDIWIQRIHPEDREQVYQSGIKALHDVDNNYWAADYRFLKKDGSYAYVKDVGHIIRDADKNPIRVVGATRDISQQRQTELILKTQLDISKTLGEATSLNDALESILARVCCIEGLDSGGIYLIDEEAEEVYLACHRGLGSDFIDAVSKFSYEDPPAKLLLSGKIAARTYDDIKNAKKATYISEGIKSYVVIPFMHQGRPVASLNLGSHTQTKISSETTLLLQSIFDGVGAAILRIRSEEKLLESEQRFRTLFDGMREGFSYHKVICDPDGNPIDYIFLMVNPAFEALTGLKAENLLGKHVKEVLPGTEDYWIQSYGKVALFGEAIEMENYSAELGRYYKVKAYSTKPGYFATVIEDVTPQRRAADELKRAKEKAEESDRLKSAFLAAMNHELRTPLNHILGFSQILGYCNDPAEIQEFADLIYKSGDHLLHLIQDIFDLALADGSTLKICPVRIDCFDIFLQNKNTLEELLSASGKMSSIKLSFNPDLSAYNKLIEVDTGKVNQVLSNLMRNAVKFTQEGNIEFGFTLINNERIRFHLRDTGIGIPKDKQEMIFDFFRQADEGNTRIYGGIGIGLAISRRVSEVLGGSLTLKSQFGEGSSFYFEIPCVVYDSKQSNRMDESIGIKVPNLAGKTVLIVEDDDVSMIVAQRLVAKTGANTLQATDGEIAVDLISKKMPDLVLMDKKMPHLDGVTATQQIKALFPSLPVLALSANLSNNPAGASEDDIFDAVISKPLSQEILFRLLEQYLR